MFPAADVLHFDSGSFDFWSKPALYKVVLTCMMPNSIIIPLSVSNDAVISDIKDELWEEARKFPLQGLLKEQSSYNFVCVNSMAEREELIDETRRLCDVKPYFNILKIVERVGDKAEDTLNHKIGQLIGKALHDFDSLKSLEVNEFRWRMKMVVTETSRSREEMDITDRIRYHYPCDIAESDELPDYLEPKLHDGGIMLVTIRIENVETSFNFSIAHNTTPHQLMTMALQRNATLLGHFPIEESIANGHVLKASGRQEYLIGDCPLSRFLYVRTALAKEIQPSFIVVSGKSVLFEPSLAQQSTPSAQEHENPKRMSRNLFPTLRKKQPTASSWSVDALFSFRVDAVSQFNSGETEVGIQAGLFLGGRSLCEARKTHHKTCVDGECTWNEELTFDIKVNYIFFLYKSKI